MSVIQPLDSACLGDECTQRLCRKMRRELGSFSFLDEGELDLVSPYFNCRIVEARTNLWLSGDSSDCVFFIVSGKVQMKVDTEFPGKQVVVGVFTRGAVIGVRGLVGNEPHDTSAMAMEDSGFLLLAHENFEKLIADHPGPGVRLLRGMLFSESIRLHRAYARLASIF